jgi:hypothetical protein
VNIIFDNVHFMRDPARDGSTNVPSDLEQIPSLLNFIKSNGTLYTNNHTPLISHTSDDIITTWLGMVGPGVANAGEDDTTWVDHTDIRATELALLGLKDDYTPDGRLLAEHTTAAYLPAPVAADKTGFVLLAQAYKQINAPLGLLGLSTLATSTIAIESGSAQNDSTFTYIESSLSSIARWQQALAAQMNAQLTGATFNGQALDHANIQRMFVQSNPLLGLANTLRDKASADN